MSTVYNNVDVEETFIFIRHARMQLASVKENFIVAIAMIFGAIALIALSVFAFGFSPEGDIFAFMGVSVGASALCFGIFILVQAIIEFNDARHNLLRAVMNFSFKRS